MESKVGYSFEKVKWEASQHFVRRDEREVIQTHLSLESEVGLETFCSSSGEVVPVDVVEDVDDDWDGWRRGRGGEKR